MSKSAKSVHVFGIYLGLLGAVLIIVPNFLLGIFRIPITTEGWLRVVGMLLFLLGYYYIRSAQKEMTDFYLWTVHARTAVFVFLAAFILLGYLKPIMILLGVIDLFGALWTGITLRTAK